MPVKRSYEFHTAQIDDFGSMCDVLLAKIPPNKIIVRLVFFGNPRDNLEFIGQLGILNSKVCSFFKEATPALSYIPQKPLNGELLLEACFIESNPGQLIHSRHFSDIRYIAIETGSSKELFIGGVMADDLHAGRFDQATKVFDTIHSILRVEGMPVNSIFRQWNYIESITAISSGKQNYREFNRARSRFYSSTSWENGYPAATGIGIKIGGVIVEIEALKCLGPSVRNVAINNSFQVPAHQYSCKVLEGNEDSFATPKFERARLLSAPEDVRVYVSGTAAIRGEASVPDADATEQARITMENISNLIAAATLESGNGVRKEPVFEVLVIYLKNESDYIDINRFMNSDFPTITPVFLLADICRDELLVEIEAVVSIRDRGTGR
ncbi:MAG: endoribonuclease L-PSP [Bacteroidia bacterium]|nr:endoribonuclease L-PSP [Bacteroidia bacterium]